MQGGDLAVEPHLAAVALDDVGERAADADRALRVEAEALERALLHEVGEERPRRDLVGVDREDRRGHVAKQPVHGLVRRRLGQPLLERELLLRQLALARAAELRHQLRAPLGDLVEQHRPAALGRVDRLALDPEDVGGIRDAQLEGRADVAEGLLHRAAELDGDRAGVDLEAVDLERGGAAPDTRASLDEQRPVAGHGEARRGAQAAHAGADDQDVALVGHVPIPIWSPPLTLSTWPWT